MSGTSRPRDRLREVLDVLLIDVADVVADEDVVEHETQLPGVGSRGGGHEGPPWACGLNGRNAVRAASECSQRRCVRTPPG
jgi:hypothetical protein